MPSTDTKDETPIEMFARELNPPAGALALEVPYTLTPPGTAPASELQPSLFDEDQEAQP